MKGIMKKQRTTTRQVDVVVIPKLKIDSILSLLISHIVHNLYINGEPIFHVGDDFSVGRANELRDILSSEEN